jgi:putative FmdB family regulatory protein
MPTYEYACRSCGEHIEVVQSFTDDPLTECPRCHGELRKVFGNVGIAFKGSGFYKNDSRAKTSSVKPAETPAGESTTSSTPPTPSESTAPKESATPATPAAPAPATP